MAKFTFRGLIAPVFTPFKSDFSLNLEIIPKYVNYLNQNKIHGILVHGTTGEGPSMSFEERKHVSEVWLKEAKKHNICVMLQVGGAPFPDVIALAKHAEAIGADAILSLPELYIKPTTTKEAIEYLKTLSAAAPETPLFYYNIPKFTNDELNMADLITQAKKSVNTFNGIKFSSNDFEKAKAALQASGDDCAVFLGSHSLLFNAFTNGFDSSIGTTFNMMTDGSDILESVKNKDMNLARKHQDKIDSTVKAITQYGSQIESMKVMMRLLTNIDVGPTRPPWKCLSEEGVVKMNEDLVKLGYKTYLQNK